MLKEAISLAIEPNSGVTVDFAMALSSLAHDVHGASWDSWIAELQARWNPAPLPILFCGGPILARLGISSPRCRQIFRENTGRGNLLPTASPEDLGFTFAKYVEAGRFTAILDMVGYHESFLTTAQCVQALQGLMGELREDTRKMQGVQYEVVHMIKRSSNARTWIWANSRCSNTISADA